MSFFNRLAISLLGLGLMAMVVAGCNDSDLEEDTVDVVAAPVGCDEDCASCVGDASVRSADGCCGKCLVEAASENSATSGLAGGQTACPACAAQGLAPCQECAETQTVSVDAANTPRVNTMPEDRDIFHYLLQNHEKVTREVKILENGVETVTESNDPLVAEKIQQHVASMSRRVEDGRPIRMWDELYQQVFKHADKIKMEIANTEKGISVTATADDPYVIQLIQSHAKVVSGFAENGFDEARQNHEPPKQ